MIDDHELRARFRRMRDDDRAHAPAIHPLLERARAEGRFAQGRRGAAMIWLGAAASVLLALALTLRSAFDSDVIRLVAVSPDETPAGIAEWTSPTAGLLATARPDVLTPGSFATSVLDLLTFTPPVSEGDTP